MKAIVPTPDTLLAELSDEDFGFALVLLGTIGIYANSEELAKALGVKHKGDMHDGKDLKRCRKMLHAAGITTPRAMGAHFHAPVAFTATRQEVARYADRSNCHQIATDNGTYCNEHGSYVDHEPWTYRGCPGSATEADFAVWVLGVQR